MGVLATISFGGWGNTGASGYKLWALARPSAKTYAFGEAVNQAALHAEPAIAGQPRLWSVTSRIPLWQSRRHHHDALWPEPGSLMQ
jgi:hypothetical protein